MTRGCRSIPRYNLPPALVARAKRILRARTETEAIVRSLQEVAREDEIHRAVRRAGASCRRFGPCGDASHLCLHMAPIRHLGAVRPTHLFWPATASTEKRRARNG